MARTTRTYDHFCMLARALEQVGDRWTLLVVRDLLGGPRRFTDLMGLLGGITPKTLSQRLRELESAGIVDVDREPGRREVWYSLTPAGEELAPGVEALFLWGLRHAGRPPTPGEKVHPEHLLTALRILLEQTASPRRPLIWLVTFADDGTYTLAFDGDTWTLTNRLDGATPDVAITTSSEAWTRFLMTPEPDRPSQPPGVEIAGHSRQIAVFRRLVARFPEGAG
jgi:DNA-binding HxlR family transcriptional regulator